MLTMRMMMIGLMALPLAAASSPAAEPGAEDRMELLRDLQREMIELRERVEEKDREIEELNQRLDALRPPPLDAEPAPPPPADPTPRTAPPVPSDRTREEAINQAIEDLGIVEATPAAREEIASARVGGANLRLIDVSMNLSTVVGASTAEDEVLEVLQGGAHDPKRRGFTLQQAELSLTGAVDPYFYGEFHAVFFEEGVELEEAFALTQALPHGLQLEAGYFLTEFGRINPLHPHSWDWIDQPIINTRIFGGDGMRGTGARLGWLTPLPWYSELHFGVQNATGDRMPSFRGAGLGHAHGGHEEEEAHFEEGIGGRPIVERGTHALEDLTYLLRWVNAWDLSDEWSLQLGASTLYGPNNTGPDADTWVYGGDLVVKWLPEDNNRGWPFVTWQTEVIGRDFEAASFLDADEGLFFPADDLNDWGVYTQALHGFTRGWSAGLRYEYVSGHGASFEEGARISRAEDPFRGDRQRLSPLLMWQPTEFSRVRLQYNYDMADHLDGGDAHSVWLGLEVLFGAHSAHRY